MTWNSPGWLHLFSHVVWIFSFFIYFSHPASLPFSLFAKWLHAFVCLQSPVAIKAAKTAELREESRHGISIFIYLIKRCFWCLVISAATVLHVKHPSSVPFKILPQGGRGWSFFLLCVRREWKSRPISLFNVDMEKKNTQVKQQNSLQLLEEALWFGIERGSPGVQTYFA